MISAGVPTLTLWNCASATSACTSRSSSDASVRMPVSVIGGTTSPTSASLRKTVPANGARTLVFSSCTAMARCARLDRAARPPAPRPASSSTAPTRALASSSAACVPRLVRHQLALALEARLRVGHVGARALDLGPRGGDVGAHLRQRRLRVGRLQLGDDLPLFDRRALVDEEARQPPAELGRHVRLLARVDVAGRHQRHVRLRRRHQRHRAQLDVLGEDAPRAFAKDEEAADAERRRAQRRRRSSRPAPPRRPSDVARTRARRSLRAFGVDRSRRSEASSSARRSSSLVTSANVTSRQALVYARLRQAALPSAPRRDAEPRAELRRQVRVAGRSRWRARCRRADGACRRRARARGAGAARVDQAPMVPPVARRKARHRWNSETPVARASSASCRRAVEAAAARGQATSSASARARPSVAARRTGASRRRRRACPRASPRVASAAPSPPP